jgi:hypothetical protein
MKHTVLCLIAERLIHAKNMGDLHQRSVVAWGVPHHMAREEADMAAINPVHH